MIGVASTAPGYSLAASLGLVTDAAGAQAPAILWLAFIPMLFIAAAYFYLNRADPDCGTTFTWATRALGPIPGWLTGWTIIIADLVVMPSLAQITGSYVFLLFGADGPAGNKYWTMLVGVIFILAMTLICVIGIELNAKTQVGLLAAELIILVVFAVVALYKVYNGDIAGSVDPSLSWVNPVEINEHTALSGRLPAALFIYWGWDTAVTVNEETKDAKRTPGVAALVSTLVLVGIYLIVAIAAQAVKGPGLPHREQRRRPQRDRQPRARRRSTRSSSSRCSPRPPRRRQTTILPAARSELSMAVHRALPKWCGQINPEVPHAHQRNWAFGIFSALFYAGLTLISDNVLSASIDSVGLMIAIYYGLTGIITPIYYWRFVFKSPKNFLFVALAPFTGGVILFWTFVKSTMDSFQKPETKWFGIESYWVMGMIILAIGIPIMLWCWTRDRVSSSVAYRPARPATRPGKGPSRP